MNIILDEHFKNISSAQHCSSLSLDKMISNFECEEPETCFKITQHNDLISGIHCESYDMSLKRAKGRSTLLASQLCQLPWLTLLNPMFELKSLALQMTREQSRLLYTSCNANTRRISREIAVQIFDVLESQARSAFLPDAAISTILGQLDVNITYEPLQCQKFKTMDNRCIIVGTTVTGICVKTMATQKCVDPGKATITPVPMAHTSISETISTTSIIMANWQKAMWESVVNRAVRTLASGPFASHFFSATSTAGGN
ncbi:hypothetical protein KIN20_015157 [Parelaphostrongylus tenuis]|uniref:Uncharacterized protein n=1 Tax=Parelaphostrongylus tenuis TaxID=148309 RepID=A0AAD5MEH5_PARTN|nr:hypothetical protein KIN20_015157 [Parelaphostrongylus tenuis]